MNKLKLTGIVLGLLWALAAALVLFRPESPEQSQRLSLAAVKKPDAAHERDSFSSERHENPIERAEYELRRLIDPKTGRIPPNMRARELAFVRALPARESMLKKGGAELFPTTWMPRGPINVGGRTRALAVDLNYNGTSNRRILAGGVTGGMFLSEDDGATWKMTTTLEQTPSVTCLAQDPNNRAVWYYGTGEFIGTVGKEGRLHGHGIFKSTDGGNTWTQLPGTVQNNQTNRFDSLFDFVWNIAVSLQHSAVVFAATYGGIFRSHDGGSSWQLRLGPSSNQSDFSPQTDVAIASDGAIYATLSRPNGLNILDADYGVFRSITGGDNWTDITPDKLVRNPHRMVLGTAPSDPNTVHLLVQATPGGESAEDHQFFRYHAGTNNWTELSSRLPNDATIPGGSFNSQGGYDLLVQVKPDNPNVVWIGGTNLFRSTDGGQNFEIVGGYKPIEEVELYNNHHPDQHAMAFFPNNPNAMISGHDGGLSKTTNALQSPQTWTSLNMGYVTTQFYAVAIDPLPGSNTIIGGLQDNSSWATEAANYQTPWALVGKGDGGFAAITPGGYPYYFSQQHGNVFRRREPIAQTDPRNRTLIRPKTPNGSNDFLFITPYQLDPNDPKVMYIAVANGAWRNSNLEAIPDGNQNLTDINWSELSASAVPNAKATALAVSKTPANRLYFGAVVQGLTALVRVDNAPANPAGVQITPPGVTPGSYPACIAINPDNADEIIAVFSNYNVPSIFYSTNGGASWTDIEGNLAGENGPSLRWANIVPTNNGKVYFLATSAGMYSTTELNGANTTWVQEASSTIGNVVVDMIVSRPIDGMVVAATHGRGVYSAQLSGSGGTTALRNFDPQGRQIVWMAERAAPLDSGFVFGTNIYNDRAKAAAFQLPGGATQASVTEVKVWFGYKRSGLTNLTYHLEIYNGNPTTGPQGAAIFSQSHALANVLADDDFQTNEQPTVHPLSQPVTVGSTFFVAINFGLYSQADWASAAIEASELLGHRAPEEWELWSDGTWHNVSDAWKGDQNATPGSGRNGWQTWIEATVSTRTAVNEPNDRTLPKSVVLDQNYPNPFNRSTERSRRSPETSIRYELPQNGNVALAVFDLNGRRVALLESGPKTAGQHFVRWDGRDSAGNRVSSGVYFYRLEAASPDGTATVLTKKMIVMK